MIPMLVVFIQYRLMVAFLGIEDVQYRCQFVLNRPMFL